MSPEVSRVDRMPAAWSVPSSLRTAEKGNSRNVILVLSGGTLGQISPGYIGSEGIDAVLQKQLVIFSCILGG